MQARPSTVVSLKAWPTLKEMLVVRTLVEVLMDSSSPCWLISTTGLEAAATAIFLKNTLTPDPPPHTHKHSSYRVCCVTFAILTRPNKATSIDSSASRNHFNQHRNFCSFPPARGAAGVRRAAQLFSVTFATLCGPRDFCSLTGSQ